jgi:uncharacterized membrane protein
MSNLFVLEFDDESTAQRVMGTLKSLQDRYLIKIEDAAILTRRPDGKPKIKQLHDLVGAGALGGAFWGMLIGLLFLMPLVGAAIGAGAGAIAGKLSDIGISDDFIRELGNTLQPGQAALFLLTSQGVLDKVVPELKQYKFKVLQTSLSEQDEAKLHEMLGMPTTA